MNFIFIFDVIALVHFMVLLLSPLLVLLPMLVVMIEAVIGLFQIFRVVD